MRKVAGNAGDRAAEKRCVEAIVTTVSAFQANIVLVIEDSFLENNLRFQLSDKTKVIRLPKSCCVSSAAAGTQDELQMLRDRSIHQYFHGIKHIPACVLHPFKTVIKASDVKIYRIGSSALALSDSLLPAGGNSASYKDTAWKKPIPVPINKQLNHCLLALSQAESVEVLHDTPMHGFVLLLSVSEDKSTLQILSPSACKDMPGLYLILTDNRFVDTS